jgi:hypothetical protein
LHGTGREARQRKDELGWEWRNYAPENKRVQGKIKKVEDFSQQDSGNRCTLSL